MNLLISSCSQFGYSNILEFPLGSSPFICPLMISICLAVIKDCRTENFVGGFEYCHNFLSNSYSLLIVRLSKVVPDIMHNTSQEPESPLGNYKVIII